MSLVQNAIRAQVTSCTAAALLAAGLSGCFGSADEGSAPDAGARVGEVRLANCSDWKKADVRERYGTVKDLRYFAGGPAGAEPGGHGATLDDDKAYKLFQNYCSKEFARGFKLYKLYTRAAAFTER